MTKMEILLPTDSNDPQKFLKDLIKANFIWLPIFVIIYCILNTHRWPNVQDFLRHSIIPYSCLNLSMLGSYLYYLIEGFIYKKMGKEAPGSTTLRTIVLSVVFGFLGLQFGFFHLNFSPFMMDYGIGMIYAFLFIAFFTGSDFIIAYKNQAKEGELKIKELERQSLQAKLSALTAQLNPHLLFNSLNTIASTISEGKADKAEEMVVQLSELYRATLKATKLDHHSLEEEIHLCESYLNIEQARFSDRLEFEIQIDESIHLQNIKVPVLLLQPIVENSIKHGIAPKREGGVVKIQISKEEEKLKIKVEDNGSGSTNTSQVGEKHGLKSCESRLKILYGNKASFQFFTTNKGAKTEITMPQNKDDHV